jgi:hypothetical protein
MPFPKDLEVVKIDPETEALYNQNHEPMPLELTNKAKAMIPNKCPYCECGLLKDGQSGKDFGGCPTHSFKLVHNSGESGWTIEADLSDGDDLYGFPQSVFGESSPRNNIC